MTDSLNLSPVMAQYWQIKKENPESLLFFRMGDFYELFFEDAVVASEDLGIALTKRGKKDGQDIPMCGVPAHTYEAYLAKLIQKGHKVAICEQTEDPETAKKRGNKGPLNRDVVRVVTAGTLTEEGLLMARRNNFLLAFSPPTKHLKSTVIGVAMIDVSTGSFLVEETDIAGIPSVLARLEPAEIIIPDRLLEDPALYEHLAQRKRQLSPLPQARFDLDNGRKRLQEVYNVHSLDGFGHFSDAQVRAAGAIVDYIQITQKTALRLLDRPRVIHAGSLMAIDAATRRSLEIDYTLSGQRQGSLLLAIDRTITASGGRLLALRLSAPLTNCEVINQRLDTVSFFVEKEGHRLTLRTCLRHIPDMERALSRINLGRGTPRDLAAIRDGLKGAEDIKQHLSGDDLPVVLLRDVQNLGHHMTLIDRLQRALGESLPLNIKDGDFIAAGYNTGLDTFRELRDNSKVLVQDLQDKYAQRTGISTLKIRHNNVLGYHIDITPSHAAKIPEDFIHRQTLASSLRYTTTELAELERRIEAAARQAFELELKLFADLITDVQGHASAILVCCRSLASLDVSSALADLAVTENYTRPIVDDSLAFNIQKGRHPVVAQILHKQSEPFVANNCHFESPVTLILLTGPNMAGKSTYLRQNALLAILAQMGSFIPAEKGHIGVVDRIFSRVGASDDLASGRSTFMVEMIETAAILHQATRRSFVILDEIGRGTSTFDGLSIAWSVVETLCNTTQCRGIFATHYHELTQLKDQLSQLTCATMRIQEWENKVVFMHEVIPGCADKSYGLHVAALAGIPQEVISRAQQILHTLESKEKQTISAPNAANIFPVVPKVSESERYLIGLDVDNLSPREALDVLYSLKKKVA